jgi:hypothetical protein
MSVLPVQYESDPNKPNGFFPIEEPDSYLVFEYAAYCNVDGYLTHAIPIKDTSTDADAPPVFWWSSATNTKNDDMWQFGYNPTDADLVTVEAMRLIARILSVPVDSDSFSRLLAKLSDMGETTYVTRKSI